jgi:hypothetical protein
MYAPAKRAARLRKALDMNVPEAAEVFEEAAVGVTTVSLPVNPAVPVGVVPAVDVAMVSFWKRI